MSGSLVTEPGGLDQASTAVSAVWARAGRRHQMPEVASDSVQQVVDSVIGWAEAHNLPVVRGLLDKEAPIAVCFAEVNSPKDVAPFLATAGKLKPTVVVLTVHELTAEDVQDALDQLQERGADAETVSHVRECTRHVGQAASVAVDIFVSTNELILRFALTAKWYDLLFAPHDGEVLNSPPDPEWEAHQAERKLWTRQKKTDVARQAAADARFPQCKTEQARLYLLHELLGSDAPRDEYIIKEVAREAKVVYDFEFKPGVARK